MIKKLSQRIFYLIMASLGTIVLGIILIFAILNYKNTINTASFMMDRFANANMKNNINEKPESDRITSKINIEGIYYIYYCEKSIKIYCKTSRRHIWEAETIYIRCFTWIKNSTCCYWGKCWCARKWSR